MNSHCHDHDQFPGLTRRGIELTGPVLGRFTRLGRDRLSGRLCVIKGPFSPCRDPQQFSREADALSTLAMAGVVGLRHCFREYRRCWLMLEWLPGSSPDYRHYSAARTGWMIARLGRILTACHKRGLIHGDLCPANIHVAGDQLWLLDFGAALVLGQRYPWRRQVRPVWSSPALLAGEGRVSEADDSYSLLLLACLLLTGQLPGGASGRADFRRWARLLQRPSRLSRRQWFYFRRLLEKPAEVSVRDLAVQALSWC